MAKEFEIAKGVKDWYGEDAILRNEIKDTLRRVFEMYGYNPVETPMIERESTMKFKGGDEIQKEIFTLQDQGKRKLALRFDQTLPLARFVASNKDIKFPYKRYVIGEVFRDGPTQPEQGRYRIFTQCDADVLGVKGMKAEAELLALAKRCFKELGLGNIVVKINNRKLLDGILDYTGVKENQKLNVITCLDKMDKIGIEGVKKELNELLDKKIVNSIVSLISKKKNNQETYESLKKVVSSEKGKQGLDEVKELVNYVKKIKIDFVDFDPSLARGLDYYTGTTIEVFLKDKSIVKSAVLAGGRYDNMISAFIGSKNEIPAVGFSFGLERVAMILRETRKKLKKSNTQLYLIPINTADECFKIAEEIRNKGINVDIDLKERKMGAAINYADSLGIGYIGIIGEDEIKEKSVSVKNLKTRQQKKIKVKDIKKFITKNNSKIL
ncbi:MAG: histidine--tRNA ligase [Candidatus Nanoarchaeia archaeon]|nr:histidine--tRNA ligase [Candidatus Nanoarchaeia archaeon]